MGLFQNPSNVVEIQWRDVDGGSAGSGSQVGPTGSAKWLEIVKVGPVFSAYYATTTGTPTASDWIFVGLVLFALFLILVASLAVSFWLLHEIAKLFGLR